MQFAQRLQETKEFKPDVEKLFTERFVDCHLRGELEGKENGIFSQIGASIPPEVVSQARDDELRRYNYEAPLGGDPASCKNAGVISGTI